MRYSLVCDDEGHWFVIPTNLMDDWFIWLDTQPDHSVPEYAEMLSGPPSCISFTKWEYN